MKRILCLVVAGMFTALAASAATVPGTLKAKVATDDQLASVRGGRAVTLPQITIPPIQISSQLLALPVAVPVQNGTALVVFGWFYIQTPGVTVTPTPPAVVVNPPMDSLFVKSFQILR